MPQGELGGWQAKLRINNVPFKFQRLSWRDKVGEGNVANSEGGPFEDVRPTLGGIEVTVTSASLDLTEPGLFIPGALQIIRGATIAIAVFPEGVDEPALGVIPKAMVREVNLEVDVNNLQPLSFTARNQGEYFGFGEVE
jgi:hypothetical protein